MPAAWALLRPRNGAKPQSVVRVFSSTFLCYLRSPRGSTPRVSLFYFGCWAFGVVDLLFTAPPWKTGTRTNSGQAVRVAGVLFNLSLRHAHTWNLLGICQRQGRCLSSGSWQVPSRGARDFRLHGSSLWRPCFRHCSCLAGSEAAPVPAKRLTRVTRAVGWKGRRRPLERVVQIILRDLGGQWEQRLNIIR